MKSLYLVLSLCFLISCNSTSSKSSEPKTIITPAEPNRFGVQEDCYADRKTVKIVGNRAARVLVVGGVTTLDCYELRERYEPCQLPDWAVDGTEVVISGVTKTIKENERRAGTPFFISEIKKK